MPRKTTGRLVIDGEPESVTPETNTAAPHQGVSADALDADIDRVLDEIGESGGAVVLWRERDNAPGQYDYLVRQPARGFTLEYVRENFGGGSYKIVPVDPVHGALNAQFFTIDKRWVGRAFQTNTPPQQGSSREDERRDKMFEMMFAALVNRQNQPSETVALIAALAPLLKGDTSANPVELMKTTLETATTLAQAMNPPEGFGGVVAGLLPAIDKLASAHQLTARRQAVARALPAVTPVRPPNPETGVRIAPDPDTPTPSQMVAGTIFPKWLEPFRSYAKRLVKLADNDANPTLYADLVIDALTDDENEAALRGALDAMKAETLESDAFNAVPEMRATPQREQWLKSFVSDVRVGLTELVEQADDSEGAANA